MSTPAGFVGRQGELRILGERLAAAGMGHPQVVYLEGEAGGGKSTLLSTIQDTTTRIDATPGRSTAQRTALMARDGGGHGIPDFVAGCRVPAAATWSITLASETLHGGR